MKTIKTRRLIPALAGGLGVAALAGMALPAAHAKAVRHPVAAPKAKITAAQAEAVTLRKFPGKIVSKTTLENEEGKWQYGVMVRSGKTLREVMVGAYSGKIEDVEVTTEAKEGIEKKAEDAAAKAKHK